MLKHHIPWKTDRWDVQQPGFTEIDLVTHSGSSASGDFCQSLNLTDIHTTWTETRAVLGKGQEGVRRALDEMRQALPFPLQGIDSDNGSEFINDHLYRYCQAQQIQFTRGRPYKKDDNAHIEQKNWTHVRRLLGYLRYDSRTALEAIDDLYRNELRLFQNLFLPSVKLQRKVRVGSRLRRCYQAPQTPFQRLCACPTAVLHPDRVAALRRLRDTLDPFALSHTIQIKLNASSDSVRRRCETCLAIHSLHRFPPPSTERKKKQKRKRKTDDVGLHLMLRDDTIQSYILKLRDRQGQAMARLRHRP